MTDDHALEFWVKDDQHLAIVGTPLALQRMGIAKVSLAQYEVHSFPGPKLILVICASDPVGRMALLKRTGVSPSLEWDAPLDPVTGGC